MQGVFRAPERREISLTKRHPELHFLSQGHSEDFEQALPGYYSIADTNECQPAAAAATTDKERLRRLPEPQITDKARKRKNADRNKEIGWHFCLLRQLRLQIAVTYVHVSSLICSLASLSCRLSQRLQIVDIVNDLRLRRMPEPL